MKLRGSHTEIPTSKQNRTGGGGGGQRAQRPPCPLKFAQACPATAAAEKSPTEGRALSHPLGFQLTPQLDYYLPRRRNARTAKKYVEKESLCLCPQKTGQEEVDS